MLFKDKVIVDGDSKGDSFLIALSRDDGRTLWRVDRTHRGISYSAPLIREMAGRIQLIQCGDRCVASFDPDTGKPLWTVDGPSEEFVATPVYSEKAGLVFVSSSWPQRHLLAIKPDGSGNVTQTHVAWRDNKGAPYVPSLIVAGDFLLSVNNGGAAFCYEAATGKVLWQERLGRHHASPVLVGGLVFFINDDGQINVIRPGAKFDRVAQYELGEHCYASPGDQRRPGLPAGLQAPLLHRKDRILEIGKEPSSVFRQASSRRDDCHGCSLRPLRVSSDGRRDETGPFGRSLGAPGRRSRFRPERPGVRSVHDGHSRPD